MILQLFTAKTSLCLMPSLIKKVVKFPVVHTSIREGMTNYLLHFRNPRKIYYLLKYLNLHRNNIALSKMWVISLEILVYRSISN